MCNWSVNLIEDLDFHYVLLKFVANIKDLKGITITNAFQKFLDESNRKPNKVWVDKGNEIYNTPM